MIKIKKIEDSSQSKFQKQENKLNRLKAELENYSGGALINGGATAEDVIANPPRELDRRERQLLGKIRQLEGKEAKIIENQESRLSKFSDKSLSYLSNHGSSSVISDRSMSVKEKVQQFRQLHVKQFSSIRNGFKALGQ